MTDEEHIQYWIDAAEEDWNAVLEIVEKNERKIYALFLAHLTIEKILKAIYVHSHHIIPPFIHDVYLLASKANIIIDEDHTALLKRINAYNIEARYPEYKNELYKRATHQFLLQEISTVSEVREWLLNELKNMQSPKLEN